MVSELYHTRILVLYESRPNSDVYHQMLIDPDQMEMIEAVVFDKDIMLSKEVYKMPDLNEVHEQVQN